MGALNHLLIRGECPLCGEAITSPCFQFKCGGKDGSDYQAGDTLRWIGVKGYVRPEDGNWDSLAHGFCPRCQGALTSALTIRGDVIRCSVPRPLRDEYQCFACERQYEEVGGVRPKLFGGSCDYGRYVCRECLEKAVEEGKTLPAQICGWCGDTCAAVLARGYHSICRDCADLYVSGSVGSRFGWCFGCDRDCAPEGRWPPQGKFLMFPWGNPKGSLLCAECVARVSQLPDGAEALCSLCKESGAIRIESGKKRMCGRCFGIYLSATPPRQEAGQ